MIIFDGYQRAAAKEADLKLQVAQLPESRRPRIAAILFMQDAGSQLYTRLKKEAAERIGMGYEVYPFSLINDPQSIISTIHTINADQSITGLIIQKPSKQIWLAAQPEQLEPEQATAAFQAWWTTLVSEIAITKDVDGLHPQTLAAIQEGTWVAKGLVMPATARAIMNILVIAAHQIGGVADLGAFLANKKITILGKSDIVGKPLFYALQAHKLNVEMIGSKELNDRIEQKKSLFESDVVVSSTGRPKLIKGEMLKLGSIVIDVGEPQPDVDRASLGDKPAFLTPVPGGVGPMTVVCLLENALTLVNRP